MRAESPQGPALLPSGGQVPGRSRSRRLGFLCLRVLLALALVEMTLRIGFFAYANLTARPCCGGGPPILLRMFNAYLSGGGLGDVGRQGDKLVGDVHRGHKMSANLLYTYPGGADLTTNSLGARGTREYPVPKPTGIQRFLALGDSMTLGHGVSDHDTWPAQLAALLPDTEVVNLGCEAYAHDQMYFALEDDGLPLRPDVVILGFHEPDLQRDCFEFYCFEKPRWVKSAEGWQVVNFPVPLPDEVRMKYLALPMLYMFPKLFADLVAWRHGGDQSGVEEGQEILGRVRRLAEGAGARFILVRLPLLGEAQGRGFFGRWCEQTGAECVDTLPAFERASGGESEAAAVERFVLPDRWHYSAAGHQIVATALRDYLATTPPPVRSATSP